MWVWECVCVCVFLLFLHYTTESEFWFSFGHMQNDCKWLSCKLWMYLQPSWQIKIVYSNHDTKKRIFFFTWLPQPTTRLNNCEKIKLKSIQAKNTCHKVQTKQNLLNNAALHSTDKCTCIDWILGHYKCFFFIFFSIVMHFISVHMEQAWS